MEKPLKTGVLGLDEPGRFLLEATRGLDYFNIVAVADSDTNLAHQFGKLWNCAAYDDYRQLIMQNQLDCLLVAAPLHTCVDYLRLGIKKKFNILKLAPLARNFTEAAELVKLADNEGVKLAVANTGRFAPGAVAFKKFMLENPAQPLDHARGGDLVEPQFFFILAAAGTKKGSDPFLHFLHDVSQPQVKWRNDPVLAGGGVLLYDCWEIIDRIVSNFGLPQQVYCAAGSAATDSRQRAYLAEDSAIITMKFNDTLSGVLFAGRWAETVCGPASPQSGGRGLAEGGLTQNRLTAQGQNVLIKLDDVSFEVTDNQGQNLRREEFDDDWLKGIKLTLENFGSHLLDPANNPIISTPAEGLQVMAFVEAAYLSAKTGMPEQPAKILKIA